jgi:hypothetical protein
MDARLTAYNKKVDDCIKRTNWRDCVDFTAEEMGASARRRKWVIDRDGLQFGQEYKEAAPEMIRAINAMMLTCEHGTLGWPLRGEEPNGYVVENLVARGFRVSVRRLPISVARECPAVFGSTRYVNYEIKWR